MYSGVGVALTAAKTVEREQAERERERDRENNDRTRERDAYKWGGVTRSCFDPTRHETPPPPSPETNEGVTAVTRSLRGVIVV